MAYAEIPICCTVLYNHYNHYNVLYDHCNHYYVLYNYYNHYDVLHNIICTTYTYMYSATFNVFIISFIFINIYNSYFVSFT